MTINLSELKEILTALPVGDIHIVHEQVLGEALFSQLCSSANHPPLGRAFETWLIANGLRIVPQIPSDYVWFQRVADADQ